MRERSSLGVSAVTLPTCAFCALAPIWAGHVLAGTLLISVLGWSSHLLLVACVPVNVGVLWIDFRLHHRRVLPLAMGAIGSAFVLLHTVEHLLEGVAEDRSATLASPMWVGMALLLSAMALDFYWMRASRRSSSACDPDEYWRAVLTGEHPGLRAGRWLYGSLPAVRRCKLCKAPVAGRLAGVMRLAGKGPSEMNPNFCRDCLVGAPIGGTELEISVLFVDVRGSTGLAERVGPSAFVQEISMFYDWATEAIVDADGLVDKLVGDEVIGLFLPGFAGRDHARSAIAAATKLIENAPLPVGAAVFTGVAYVGMVGSEAGSRDLTAMGDVMNSAARLVAEADSGELIVSESAALAAGLAVTHGVARELRVRGRTAPINARVITAADSVAASRESTD